MFLDIDINKIPFPDILYFGPALFGIIFLIVWIPEYLKYGWPRDPHE